MKNELRSLFLAVTGLFLIGQAQDARAEREFSQGEFLTVVNQVTTGEGAAAKSSDKLAEKTPVATGTGSLAELRFGDSSTLRIAPNTKLSFLSKERAVNLQSGSLLLNIPTGNGATRVEADGISGEVTGTTLMASRDPEGNFSFVILETAGTAKVSSHTGKSSILLPGQIALVRRSDGSIRIFELNLDAVVQFSPLFVSFASAMPGLEKVMEVAGGQAADVKSQTKSLLSYFEVGLKAEDPDKEPLSILFGKSTDEMVASKNPFLGELATAAGSEENRDSSYAGNVLGADTSQGGGITDARQPEGEALAAKSNPPTDQGLAGTDTAAGGGDLGSTDTAAGGGGGGADTQAPTPPVNGGVASNFSPATPF